LLAGYQAGLGCWRCTAATSSWTFCKTKLSHSASIVRIASAAFDAAAMMQAASALAVVSSWFFRSIQSAYVKRSHKKTDHNAVRHTCRCRAASPAKPCSVEELAALRCCLKNDLVERNRTVTTNTLQQHQRICIRTSRDLALIAKHRAPQHSTWMHATPGHRV